MKEHEERVVAERNELSAKHGKLKAFITGNSPAYKEAPLMEKERLHVQAYLMSRYIDVLDSRIDYFQETG